MFVDKIQLDRIVKEKQTPARRAAFIKQHGVAHGYLLTESVIEEKYQVGIFKPDKMYKAWVRYSSDTPQNLPDKNTTMGIGIKLFNVPGAKAFEEDVNATTLDFVLQNTEVFFAADVKEMYEFKAAAVNKTLTKWLETHPESAKILDEMESKTVESVLTEPLWSCISYKFGDDNYCKFKLAYESVENPESAPDYNAPDYLAKDMRERLAKGFAKLSFYVQLRNNLKTQSITSARSLWDEKEAVPVKVATLVLPRQNIISRNQAEYGESLAFNIWRTLPEMAPVGSIAEVRKVVYRSSAEVRRMVNGQTDGEPRHPRPPYLSLGSYKPTFNTQWPSGKNGDVTDNLQGNSVRTISKGSSLPIGILTVSCRDMKQSASLIKKEHDIDGVVDGMAIQVDNTIQDEGTLRILLEKTNAKSIRL